MYGEVLFFGSRPVSDLFSPACKKTSFFFFFEEGV